jgi:hypothetical protein
MTRSHGYRRPERQSAAFDAVDLSLRFSGCTCDAQVRPFQNRIPRRLGSAGFREGYPLEPRRLA